ncbi:hypothetical protein MNBD_BACTEROID02-1050 [hydrothermal vent metagenome]|uniref:Rieske domain-containing protein n=1 Tax=hydrothermal vent metagenome TaxID=652676 RepID=A0A3B0QW32_9ZZZZ
MKKIISVFLLILSLSCADNNIDPNNILPNIPVNQTVFLNNPEFIDLQVVGGWAYAQGGISGMIIYHYSINGYIAFDRAAPHISPKSCSQMIVKNSIKMFTPCDESEFNLLNGAPLTDGVNYPAKQYRVVVNGNTLQITNF